MPISSVNKITCANNKEIPAKDQVCKFENTDFLACGPGQSYVVELFDKAAQIERGTATPPSLGSFKVSQQMMECMTDNKLQIHFQYDKREAFQGGVACFDHKAYIRNGRRLNANGDLLDSIFEDEIPITTLNICNNNEETTQRCFLYGYQITILVKDSERNPPEIYPMLKPSVYARITFEGITQKLKILAGDQIAMKFSSDYTPHDGIRITPNINSNELPSPFKERYQVNNQGGEITTKLPCDDLKVADTVQCETFVAHCTDPNDKIYLTIQGSG